MDLSPPFGSGWQKTAIRSKEPSYTGTALRLLHAPCAFFSGYRQRFDGAFLTEKTFRKIHLSFNIIIGG